MITLGIDTSNYTTSLALYDSESGEIRQKRMLLPVKQGEKGLRQSDAVFHHTNRIGSLMQELFEGFDKEIDAIGVSERPRDADGSYMPCFLVGLNTAKSLSALTKKPLYGFSHQSGHIMAALYSAELLELKNEKFIAFHVSGGTTEMLLVSPDKERVFKAEIIGETKDLNCGQAVDRAGVMMKLDFPCGPALEELALLSEKSFNPKVCVSNGGCSLSGVENQCQRMLLQGEKNEDVARYCLDFVGKTLEKMTDFAVEKYGRLPLVYAGGVMCNSIIRSRLANKFDAKFAKPELSCDNAVGAAVLASVRGAE